MIKDIFVKILDIDKENDVFYIQVGSFCYPVHISEFKKMMEGEEIENINVPHIVKNIAINASLSGISLDDFKSIKTIIEKITFKV